MLTADVGHTFIPIVRRVIDEHRLRSVCDFGGGANPVLSLDDIDRLGLRYVVVDSSVDELRKTPPGYETRHLDVERPGFDLGGDMFDMVLSNFVAEHVKDPVRFHINARSVLRPGGRAAHFFPTLPAPPFVINRLLSGSGSRKLIDLLQPDLRSADGPLGHFRAHYRWCEGPSRRQYRRFASVGFTVESYVAYVGHDYLRRFAVAQRVSDAISRQLIRWPRPWFSTYAAVVLRQSV